METKYEILLRVAMGILIATMLFTTYVPVAAKSKQTDIESAIDLAMEHTYPTVGKVIKINKKKGIVYIAEVGGNVFSFKENTEFVKLNYHKGDIIVLTMYDNGTITEKDDIILKSINYGKEIL